jgi:hypothetical protein
VLPVVTFNGDIICKGRYPELNEITAYITRKRGVRSISYSRGKAVWARRPWSAYGGMFNSVKNGMVLIWSQIKNIGSCQNNFDHFRKVLLTNVLYRRIVKPWDCYIMVTADFLNFFYPLEFCLGAGTENPDLRISQGKALINDPPFIVDTCSMQIFTKTVSFINRCCLG